MPNLYLVGFMGVGKSLIGKLVGEVLGLMAIDSDVVIERREGKKIGTIFEEKGEVYFRKLEREFVECGHPAYACVVSCGGGMVVDDYVRDLLKEKGVVIVLQASLETILERTKNSKDRPLLQGVDRRERIESLLRERAEAYLDAGEQLWVDGLSVDEVVRQVVGIYRMEEGRYCI